MVCYDINLGDLVNDLNPENDLSICIDDLDNKSMEKFKLLISNLINMDSDYINLGNGFFYDIFDSERYFKKIKKWDIPSTKLSIFGSTYTDWIIDRESTETKLFRLILRKYKNGYLFADGFGMSKYKILIPEHIKIKYRNTNFCTFIEQKKKTNTDKNTAKKYDFKTNIALDKKYLLEYFKKQTAFYNRPLIELKADIYFANKSIEKINSECNDFFKAKFELYEYLISRQQYLKVNYTRADSGRYYTFISTLNKKIRKHILHGYTEYDLENASVIFLYGVFKEISNNDELDLIEYYINNKTAFRNKVAQSITTNKIFSDDDLSDAKAILTSLFFGSKATEPKEFLDRKDTDFKNAVLDILDTKVRQENFFNEPYIMKFIHQVKNLMNSISKHLKDNFFDSKNCILKVNNKKYYFRKKRKLTNEEKTKVKDILIELDSNPTRAIKRKLDQELDKLLYSRKYSPNSAVAFFYQSWESDFLTNEIKAVKKEQKNGNKDFYLLHDAIYLKNTIDKNILINAEQTGDFKVNVRL